MDVVKVAKKKRDDWWKRCGNCELYCWLRERERQERNKKAEGVDWWLFASSSERGGKPDEGSLVRSRSPRTSESQERSVDPTSARWEERRLAKKKSRQREFE